MKKEPVANSVAVMLAFEYVLSSVRAHLFKRSRKKGERWLYFVNLAKFSLGRKSRIFLTFLRKHPWYVVCEGSFELTFFVSLMQETLTVLEF